MKKDAQLLASLDASIGKMAAPLFSLRENQTLLRAVWIVDAGDSFVSFASVFVAAASWVDGFLV